MTKMHGLLQKKYVYNKNNQKDVTNYKLSLAYRSKLQIWTV